MSNERRFSKINDHYMAVKKVRAASPRRQARAELRNELKGMIVAAEQRGYEAGLKAAGNIFRKRS